MTFIDFWQNGQNCSSPARTKLSPQLTHMTVRRSISVAGARGSSAVAFGHRLNALLGQTRWHSPQAIHSAASNSRDERAVVVVAAERPGRADGGAKAVEFAAFGDLDRRHQRCGK